MSDFLDWWDTKGLAEFNAQRKESTDPEFIAKHCAWQAWLDLNCLHLMELAQRHTPTVENWTITYNPKPIPSRGDDYDFVHKDYDGPEDKRCGTASSRMDAIEQIRAMEE